MASNIFGYAAYSGARRGYTRSLAIAVIAGLFLVVPRATRAQAATPPITILQNSSQLADGLIFISPQGGGSKTPAYGIGPEIVDNQGRPVWFSPIAGGSSAADFRVQSYLGKPVLTSNMCSLWKMLRVLGHR